jgi:hypothetical protein
VIPCLQESVHWVERRGKEKKWTDDFIETHKGSLDKFKEKFYKMIPSTK